MNKRNHRILIGIAFTLVLAASTLAHSQTFSVLYNFGSNPNDPAYPVSNAIVQGRDGNLYSTSTGGGIYSNGTVFRMTTAGTLQVLHSFNKMEGESPYSGLTLSRQGPQYGSALYGGTNGSGTIFKTNSQGHLVPIYNFTGGADGGLPWAAPVQGAGGELFGTTSTDTTHNGTVYKLTPYGKLTTLHTFNNFDGTRSISPLVVGSDGILYGTSSYGGEFNAGSVFMVTTSGNFAVLYNFGSQGGDGAYPSTLIQASDGNFYGVTAGQYNFGTVFKMTPSGSLSVLHTFTGGDGQDPESGLVQATDGNLYGTTFVGGSGNCGVIFRISLHGSFSVLYNFDGITGCNPESPLVQHTDGVLYGLTETGGQHGIGTFFSLDAGLGPFVTFLPPARTVGQMVEFLGQGFQDTTNVSFNGTKANFKVISDTYLTAVVPAGATSGFVTVTTPKGELKSNSKFLVIR